MGFKSGPFPIPKRVPAERVLQDLAFPASVVLNPGCWWILNDGTAPILAVFYMLNCDGVPWANWMHCYPLLWSLINIVVAHSRQVGDCKQISKKLETCSDIVKHIARSWTCARRIKSNLISLSFWECEVGLTSSFLFVGSPVHCLQNWEAHWLKV